MKSFFKCKIHIDDLLRAMEIIDNDYYNECGFFVDKKGNLFISYNRYTPAYYSKLSKEFPEDDDVEQEQEGKVLAYIKLITQDKFCNDDAKNTMYFFQFGCMTSVIEFLKTNSDEEQMIELILTKEYIEFKTKKHNCSIGVIKFGEYDKEIPYEKVVDFCQFSNHEIEHLFRKLKYMESCYDERFSGYSLYNENIVSTNGMYLWFDRLKGTFYNDIKQEDKDIAYIPFGNKNVFLLKEVVDKLPKPLETINIGVIIDDANTTEDGSDKTIGLHIDCYGENDLLYEVFLYNKNQKKTRCLPFLETAEKINDLDFKVKITASCSDVANLLNKSNKIIFSEKQISTFYHYGEKWKAKFSCDANVEKLDDDNIIADVIIFPQKNNLKSLELMLNDFYECTIFFKDDKSPCKMVLKNFSRQEEQQVIFFQPDRINEQKKKEIIEKFNCFFGVSI